MTRAEFDAIFEKCKKKYLPTNQADIQKKLSAFVDKDGNISAQALAIFSFIETVQYTNDMLSAVLSEALVVEYLPAAPPSERGARLRLSKKSKDFSDSL